MPKSARLLSAVAALVIWSGGFADAAPTEADAQAGAPVVLLHGLARSASSMDDMAQALQAAGYRVCNIDYPSREHSISTLAASFVVAEIRRCFPDARQPLNFVTHSMGGIIVRELAKTAAVSIGRVVMLGPPNHGSEVVDALGDWRLFSAINGPAGGELSTAASSKPQSLGPATFEGGVIAGKHTINWINSLIIPGPDDGKVSLESAKLDGMRDFIVVPESHPFLMTDPQVIEQTLRFLESGCFAPELDRATTIVDPAQSSTMTCPGNSTSVNPN